MDTNAIEDNVRVRTFTPHSDNDITAALAEIEQDTKDRIQTQFAHLSNQVVDIYVGHICTHSSTFDIDISLLNALCRKQNI